MCVKRERMRRRKASYSKRLGRASSAIVGALSVLWVVTVPMAASEVHLQGSTTFSSRLIEPYRAEIERRSKQKLSVIANKSIYGLLALLERRIDMAMISSELDDDRIILQIRRPDLPVSELKSFEITRTRVAFAVHPNNSVRSVPLEQIRAILLGQIGNWKELGGSDLAITTVTVQPGGGVPTTVRGQLLSGRAFKPARLIELEAPQHVLKVIEQETGGIGIAQLGLLRGSNVVELETDARIEQCLNLVTLGDPTEQQRAVIEAIRFVAAARRF